MTRHRNGDLRLDRSKTRDMAVKADHAAVTSTGLPYRRAMEALAATLVEHRRIESRELMRVIDRVRL
jgi:hypothetical protein